VAYRKIETIFNTEAIQPLLIFKAISLDDDLGVY